MNEHPEVTFEMDILDCFETSAELDAKLNDVEHVGTYASSAWGEWTGANQQYTW